MITEKASFFNFPQGVDVGMRSLRSGTRRLSLEYLAYAIARKARAESPYSKSPRTPRTHIDRGPLDRTPAVPRNCRLADNLDDSSRLRSVFVGRISGLQSVRRKGDKTRGYCGEPKSGTLAKSTMVRKSRWKGTRWELAKTVSPSANQTSKGSGTVPWRDW